MGFITETQRAPETLKKVITGNQDCTVSGFVFRLTFSFFQCVFLGPRPVGVLGQRKRLKERLSALTLRACRHKVREVMNARSALVGMVVGIMLAVGGAGCLRQGERALTWVDFLPALTNLQMLARLDAPGSQIITSRDPTGGNDDYNHFVRKGPKGWVVLADLKGPGIVTRFWMTGADDGKHRVRFYFDGEWSPSMELSLAELTGEREPFVRPLAAYENYCWYSFVPIPYRKRLVIMAQEGGYGEGGWPRLFYQINYTTLPRTSRVESFSMDIGDEARAVLARIARAWQRPIAFEDDAAASRPAVGILQVKPGETRWLDPLTGPGIIQSLRVRPQYENVAGVVDRERLLRNVALQIRWDQNAQPSVNVPLGDFFGSVWQRTRYGSACFGMSNDTFVARFPMPFAKQADILLQNSGDQEVNAELEVRWQPLTQWDENLGYFHATWSGSSPKDIGQPHSILRTSGRGKYVGCVLGVMSEEPSWWILEGDEKMYVDGRENPDWHGTGLEDYFNGGWYYQNPLARPLHGMVYKVFFRVVQYRLHVTDAVRFDSSFHMTFERGPNHASRGWMESVAYYYLDKPQPAAFSLPAAARRQPPKDPNEERTIMTDLLNYERLSDWRGARDRVDWFLEKYPQFPFESVLRLRQLVYDEIMGLPESGWPAYQRFISQETNEAVLAQAKLLSWFHEKPNRALVGLYASGRSSVVLDGNVVCSADRPDRAVVAGVELAPGRHCLAVQAAWQPYPNWVQACVRTTRGCFGTSPDFRYAFNPAGAWGAPGFDDSAWSYVGGTGVKGPPEEPYIWLEPNAFAGLQSMAVGIRADDKEWPRRDARVVFRREFEVK
jgi:hypothetical protein